MVFNSLLSGLTFRRIAKPVRGVNLLHGFESRPLRYIRTYADSRLQRSTQLPRYGQFAALIRMVTVPVTILSATARSG